MASSTVDIVIGRWVDMLGGDTMVYFLASILVVYAVSATLIRRFDGL